MRLPPMNPYRSSRIRSDPFLPTPVVVSEPVVWYSAECFVCRMPLIMGPCGPLKITLAPMYDRAQGQLRSPNTSVTFRSANLNVTKPTALDLAVCTQSWLPVRRSEEHTSELQSQFHFLC